MAEARAAGRDWLSGAIVGASVAACGVLLACAAFGVAKRHSGTSATEPGGGQKRADSGTDASSSCWGPGIVDGLEGLIGRTPLVRIRSLSEATGCDILGKTEFLNPGGSVKDRVALRILQEALASGALRAGGTITEGTAGSTGVSLATVAPAVGVRCHVCMPDDAAVEKARMLMALGATVERLRPVSIAHPDHFVNVAKRRAAELPGAVFADQFENLANARAHHDTGREIWEQTGGRLDAFICGAGTGGTLAGVSRALKALDPRIGVYLVDPPGSSLYNKVERGVLYAPVEAEGRRLRNPFDTVTEGIGLNRLTANFATALIDGAFRGTDQECVEMAAYLMRNDGLFLGSSAAMNCVGAAKLARDLGPGHVIVTVLCDGGHRHLSKFHSPEYLASLGLTPRATGKGLEWLGGRHVDNATSYGAQARALELAPAS